MKYTTLVLLQGLRCNKKKRDAIKLLENLHLYSVGTEARGIALLDPRESRKKR